MNNKLHLRNSSDIINFLCANKKDFTVEKTASGYTSIFHGAQKFYVRDYRQNFGTLNNISTFQASVKKSPLYNSIRGTYTDEEIKRESEAINKSLIYKGFCFDPVAEKSITGVIKVDLNSAYWQTCRFMRLIKKDVYQNISRKCVKSSRLMITGTLGKQVTVTEYRNGVKVKSYPKEMDSSRILLQNIYNRVRKFVDELMIWAWRRNPSNFIGYYVDCFWLREPDHEMLELISSIYKYKIELVNLLVKGQPGKYIIIETGSETTPYDAQFKLNQFAKYQSLYNFTPELQDINYIL